MTQPEKTYSIEFTYVELGWLTSLTILQRIDRGIDHDVAVSVETKLTKVFGPLIESKIAEDKKEA